MATFKDLQKAYPEWDMYNEKEEDRLEHLQVLKAKGKGAPKKKKTADGEWILRAVDLGWWDMLIEMLQRDEGRSSEDDELATWLRVVSEWCACIAYLAMTVGEALSGVDTAENIVALVLKMCV